MQKKKKFKVRQSSKKSTGTKERDRLTKLYPIAVWQARMLHQDPMRIPEYKLQELQRVMNDRALRASRGQR